MQSILAPADTLFFFNSGEEPAEASGSTRKPPNLPNRKEKTCPQDPL